MLTDPIQMGNNFLILLNEVIEAMCYFIVDEVCRYFAMMNIVIGKWIQGAVGTDLIQVKLTSDRNCLPITPPQELPEIASFPCDLELKRVGTEVAFC